MSEFTKVFWHVAFFEALQLEFHRYQGSLKFESEVQLSKEVLKNVYLDRLIQANRAAFKEAMNMMSDVAKELFFEVAERDG